MSEKGYITIFMSFSMIANGCEWFFSMCVLTIGTSTSLVKHPVYTLCLIASWADWGFFSELQE